MDGPDWPGQQPATSFGDCGLADWSDFVVGGHEIRELSLFDEAWRMHAESRAIDGDLVRKCKPDLDKIDAQIRPGTLANVGATIEKMAGDKFPHRAEAPRAAIERVQNDLRAFVTENRLAHLVVGQRRPRPSRHRSTPLSLPSDWDSLEKLLDKPGECPLPASSLYAIAALDLGYSYVNFTPSLGASPAAIGQLALERQTRYMGNDGKTGETLLKSTLAPMFAHRHLQIMSWVGHNIFGNMDGKVLDDPVNKQTQGSPARTTSSATFSDTARKRWSASNTSPAWAIGRPPGTISIFRASSARR